MACGRLPFNDSNLKTLLVQVKRRLAFPRRASRRLQGLVRSFLTVDPACGNMLGVYLFFKGLHAGSTVRKRCRSKATASMMVGSARKALRKMAR